jgi:hypothetical protein
MLWIMDSPVIRFPSREMTAEMAHPEGMRTSPSSFIMVILSAEAQGRKTKRRSSTWDRCPVWMNAFAHLEGGL